MTVVLDQAARAELRDAALFYEQARDGLGQAFLDAANVALAEVCRHPTLWRRLRGRFRRHLLQRFPYALVYAIEGETVYVAAVMHTSRNPGYWEGRRGAS